MKIPPHIVRAWGSARAFKADKRRLLKRLERVVDDFRRGAAFFPNGAKGVLDIANAIVKLKADLSAKHWGR